MPTNYNYHHACQIISILVSLDVKQIVISPGSRSTPLTLAAEHHPQLQCFYILDERSACFFALGLSSSTSNNRPVAILATSGSAIANWYPAVVEASLSYTPLILLSADRPAQLQQCGANQTIDQTKLFGTFVKSFIQLDEMFDSYPSPGLSRKINQAVSACQWPIPGPVHINIPIAEPLLADINQTALIEHKIFTDNKLKNKTYLTFPHLSLTKHDINHVLEKLENKRGIIICGRENYPSQFSDLIHQLSQNLNCPVLADPLSNLRFEPIDNLIINYDAFLRSDTLTDAIKPDWVLRFGQFPVSKSLEKFLSKIENCHFLLCDPYGLWPDPLNITHTILRCDPEHCCSQILQATVHDTVEQKDTDWINYFNNLDQKAHLMIKNHLLHEDKSEGLIIDCLLKKLRENSLLFSSNSMPIRDLDTFISDTNTRNNITIKANRGCSGIDGNISTFTGLLAGRKHFSQAVALMGDLTFLHDLSGLILLKQVELTMPIVFIVINNGGGGIFNYLPQEKLDCFEKAWICDQDMDFTSIAGLYRLNFTRVEKISDFDTVINKVLQTNAIHLIEVKIDQHISIANHNKLFKEIKENIK
jgi:2-succinyl-5-enolpyruvyl-6-hydroxy-3-cyclohexene-1-carboxylate synthase